MILTIIQSIGIALLFVAQFLTWRAKKELERVSDLYKEALNILKKKEEKVSNSKQQLDKLLKKLDDEKIPSNLHDDIAQALNVLPFTVKNVEETISKIRG